MKKICIAAFTCLLSLALFGQQNRDAMKQLIDDNMRFAVDQYKVLMANVPPDVMPKTYDASKNQVVTSDTKWWCSGFYPGTLWYLYEYTGDTAIRHEAERRLNILEKEKHYTGNHDLGFMMYCSFGNAYRITKTPAYKDVILTSAQSLITRYRPSIQSIQSWDSGKNFKCPVIIDNMMNLELLEWSGRNGGGKNLKTIAETHANTTIKNHFRPDYSSYHVVDYDLVKGVPARKFTWQGAADSSAWSRGQAWGLYGFTVMYRFTKNDTYLNQAKHIAQFILSNPTMPADMVPYWDYDAPGIPDTYRDASAAAIAASALLELAQYAKDQEKETYVNAAEKMLTSLSSPAYRAPKGSNGGFILMHSSGAIPFKSEVDVPLTYADYYFIEALARYKKWYL